MASRKMWCKMPSTMMEMIKQAKDGLQCRKRKTRKAKICKERSTWSGMACPSRLNAWKETLGKETRKEKETDRQQRPTSKPKTEQHRFWQGCCSRRTRSIAKEKHPINTNGTKAPSKSSWAAAVLRGTKTKKGSRLDKSEKARREKKYPGHSGVKNSASSSSTPKRAARMAIPTSKRPNESSAQQHQSLRRSSSNSEKLRLRKQLQSILFKMSTKQSMNCITFANLTVKLRAQLLR